MKDISETSNIDLNYAEFGFDSDSILKGVDKGPKSPREKNQDNLRPIETAFSNEDPLLDPIAFQIIVDENAVNKYLTQHTNTSYMYSLK